MVGYFGSGCVDAKAISVQRAYDYSILDARDTN